MEFLRREAFRGGRGALAAISLLSLFFPRDLIFGPLETLLDRWVLMMEALGLALPIEIRPQGLSSIFVISIIVGSLVLDRDDVFIEVSRGTQLGIIGFFVFLLFGTLVAQSPQIWGTFQYLVSMFGAEIMSFDDFRDSQSSIGFSALLPFGEDAILTWVALAIIAVPALFMALTIFAMSPRSTTWISGFIAVFCIANFIGLRSLSAV